MVKFSKIGTGSFGTSLSKAGIGKQVMAAQVVDLAKKVISQHLPETFRPYARPIFVKNKMLAIEIDHPTIAEELHMNKQRVIADINTHAGRVVVERLQYRLAQPEENPEAY